MSLCAALALTTLTGCAANLSGLIDAHDKFGCPAAGGVNCTTLSQTYERLHAEEDLPIKDTGFLKEALQIAADEIDEPILSVVKEPLNNPKAKTEPAIVETTTVRRIPIEAAHLRPKKVVREMFASPVNRTSDFVPDRASERVMRLWILPWVDAAGDLNASHHVWMRIEDAGWRIESLRNRAIRRARLNWEGES